MIKTIHAVPSKSDAHRALICAFLSKTPCEVALGGPSSGDIEATRTCLLALSRREQVLHCRESGSTLRFLLPVVGALGMEASFYPEGRLPKRPLSPLYEEMARHGCRLSPMGHVPLNVSGKLTPGRYEITGSVSSQFISGLLFALPLLKNDSEIRIERTLQSEGYVRMTLCTLKRFGIHALRTSEGFFIPGGQTYAGPPVYKVEGDWSNAAFFLAMGALTQEGVAVAGLNLYSAQGDRRILEHLRAFGAQVDARENVVRVTRAPLHGIEIDAGQIPDLVPALAVLAAGANGTTLIYNAGRLRLKESDRLKSISAVIRGIGGDVTEQEDGLVIRGAEQLTGGSVSSFGDHRIAMMASAASLICKEPVTLFGADAVRKSCPGFFEDVRRLGLDGRIRRR